MKSPENMADVVAVAGDPLSLSRQLLSSIPTVQSFRGRWIAVETTVHRLHRSLSSLNPNPNPNLSSLLISLSQTLILALALSLQSQSSSPPPSGKLRTQSDISTAAADLDRLSSDLDLLLFEEQEEAEDPIKTLVSRLQFGSSLSRLAALETLTPILRHNDKNVVIAASHGAVPAIVRLLDLHDTRIPAAAAVARVSAVDICREALAAEGSVLLNHLCRVLESDSGSAKENACFALEALTLGRESATSVGSCGGIRSLLEICRSGTPSAAASAAGVLKNLAGVKELRRRFIEENAVPVLIRVLSSGTPPAMGNSVGCLRNLATVEEEEEEEEGGVCLNMLLLKEGILNCLRNYWEKGCELEPVIGLIRNLALSGYGLHAVHLSGLLPRVVSAMDSLSSAVRAEAARAVAEFSGKLGKEAAAEAVPMLVRMLEKGMEEKAAAVQALASLVTMSSGNRRAFRREEKGIVNAVMLLDPLVWSVDKRYPVMVLLSVSQSRRCRRQMAACGACEYLKRLAGSEVEGAKRLKDSLERGKIFGVFPRN